MVNWVKTIPGIATVGAVGIAGSEAEEEVPSSPKRSFSSLESAVDTERQETLEYLKDFRKQKSIRERLGYREQARAEMNRILEEDGKRSESSSSSSSGAASDADENGKPARRKAPARRTPAVIRSDRPVEDGNGNPRPGQFTEQDRERASENRDRRHGRRWYQQQLLAIAEGKVSMSKEQCQALLAFGRLKGWHRRPSSER